MTAQEFIAQFPDQHIPNDGCLRDIACPQCGQRRRFSVRCIASFALTDDGVGRDEDDARYDSESTCVCPYCERESTVKGFTIEGLDNLIIETKERRLCQTNPDDD